MLENIRIFIFQKVVPVLVQYVLRWSIKFVGSVLIYAGMTEAQYQELIAGIITFAVGILWTLIVDKKKGNGNG